MRSTPYKSAVLHFCYTFVTLKLDFISFYPLLNQYQKTRKKPVSIEVFNTDGLFGFYPCSYGLSDWTSPIYRAFDRFFVTQLLHVFGVLFIVHIKRH